jgi:hypothetical protein
MASESAVIAVVLTKAMAVAITITVTCRDSLKMYMPARSVVEVNLSLAISLRNVYKIQQPLTMEVMDDLGLFINDVRANPSLAATNTPIADCTNTVLFHNGPL